MRIVRRSIVLHTLLMLALATESRAADSVAGSIGRERVQAAVDKLDALAGDTLKQTGVPGIAIVVVHQNEVVFKKGFGVREAGKPEPIDAETVFQVASVSKPITSTVLAALVGEGKVAWDDRVIDHDPAFRMYDPYVTRELRLRDLLCHRSGLPDHAGDLLEDIGYDRQEILRRLRYQPPDSSFRAGYAYTNFGYSEAAYAACLPTGKPWAEVAEERLFGPLGMKSSSFRFADYERHENRARLHVLIDGKWTAKNTRQPDAQAPAGGASTTLNDLVAWMRLQLNDGQVDGRQLITAAALADTHTPQMLLSFNPEQGRQVSYGLGWNVSIERGGRVFWKHSGGFSLGMRTEVSFMPTENIAIAVLSNAGSTGVPEGLTESFFDLVVAGKLERDWVEFANRMFDEETKRELGAQTDYSRRPDAPTSALRLTAYAGKYANELFGTVELTVADEKLTLHVGPKPISYELRHWDRDEFTFQPVGESAGGLSGVRFSIDAAGQADQVLIEYLNLHGQGTFARVK